MKYMMMSTPMNCNNALLPTLTQVNQSFVYFLASNLLKQWKKTLFINLEVPKDTVLQNILASYSGKHLNDIIKQQGWTLYETIWTNTQTSHSTIVDNKWDWESISSFIISHKPEVVFIDFIQNIEIEWNNVYEQMSS